MLLAASAGKARLALAEDPPCAIPPSPENQSVPLAESDLQTITLEVLKQRPLLSASPGIKYAEADCGYPFEGPAVSAVVHASVIFHPHFDSGGVKQAYQVHCERLDLDGRWVCPSVRIRRYLRVEGQDFETRVIGEVGNDAARALIEATREMAPTGVPGNGSVPGAATMVVPVEGKYLVSWGSNDGQHSVAIEATLRSGGDPANPRDWETKVFEPESAD